MSTLLLVPPLPLVSRLGIPPGRIQATAQLATVAELAHRDGRWDGRLCELFEGVVVEKPMGYAEAKVQTELSAVVRNYLQAHPLGILAGSDGPIDFGNGVVYLPDLSFLPWDRCPDNEATNDKVCPHIPTLVAEVLSDSNTVAELAHKREVYFRAGVQLVWEIDIQIRTVAVYTHAAAPDVVLTRTQSLDGGEVLPGFTLLLADLFAVLDRRRPR